MRTDLDCGRCAWRGSFRNGSGNHRRINRGFQWLYLGDDQDAYRRSHYGSSDRRANGANVRAGRGGRYVGAVVQLRAKKDQGEKKGKKR